MDDLVSWEGSPWHPRRYRHHRPLDVFDEESRRMEREVDRMKRDMNHMMSNMDRRLHHIPNWDIDERPFDLSLEHRTEGTEATPGKYTVNIPVGKSIGPHDLKVSCENNVMTVEAKKDRKSADGTCRVYHEFTRKFTLPENVNMMNVKSVLTPDGCLKIEAPLPTPAIEEPPKPTEIPIQIL